MLHASYPLLMWASHSHSFDRIHQGQILFHYGEVRNEADGHKTRIQLQTCCKQDINRVEYSTLYTGIDKSWGKKKFVWN